MLPYCELRLHMLSTAEGGRTTPIYPNGAQKEGFYMPHVRTSPDGEYLGVALLRGPHELWPGMDGEVVVACIYHPNVDYSSLTPGAAVEVLEGRTIIARGVVLRRWEGGDDWRSGMPT
ncbi:MAG TPA: hypothetical protein VF192_10780 [Longimicrobiales bacterium]